jgi:hypothetical protein
MAIFFCATVNAQKTIVAIGLMGILAVGWTVFYGFWPKKGGLDQGIRSSVSMLPSKVRAPELRSPNLARSDTPIIEPDSSVPVVMDSGAEDFSGLTGKIFTDDGEASDEFFRHFEFTDAQKNSFKAVMGNTTRALQYIESRNMEVLKTNDGSSQFMIHPFVNLGRSMLEETPKVFKRFPDSAPEAAIEYLMREATLGHEDYFAGFGQYTREFRVVREGGEYVMTETRILPGGTEGEPVRMDGPVRRFTKPPKRYEHLFETDANGKKE